mmetsp:Transcript_16395/g.39324  ORF Transcript_16395/g.39324 Transcript_16395/m.39324 type:complete len:212 (+) Transcript_16395:50-685(+)
MQAQREGGRQTLCRQTDRHTDKCMHNDGGPMNGGKTYACLSLSCPGCHPNCVRNTTKPPRVCGAKLAACRLCHGRPVVARKDICADVSPAHMCYDHRFTFTQYINPTIVRRSNTPMAWPGILPCCHAMRADGPLPTTAAGPHTHTHTRAHTRVCVHVSTPHPPPTDTDTHTQMVDWTIGWMQAELLSPIQADLPSRHVSIHMQVDSSRDDN